jgi:multicomponent Na+:H+ antiporter subunit D
MIEQLPVLNMLAFLGMGLAIPLLKRRPFRLTMVLGFVVLSAVLVSSGFVLSEVGRNGAFAYRFGAHEGRVGIELMIDGFSAFFAFFVVALVLPVYVYSCGDATEGIYKNEYGRFYILLFVMLFAMLGIIYTNDLFNTYVFMEIIAITSGSIISIKRKKENYAAAFRYMMLNEMGSLSFLLGVALLYMATGYTNIDLVASRIGDLWATYPFNMTTVLSFMIVGFGIKAAIFPLHVWLPDAYSTAPTSSSAILSGTVGKVYMLILIKLMFRVFGVDVMADLNIPQVLVGMATLGMILGSVFALAQKDIKRMLAYSSVAQIGYIVMAVGLFSALGLRAAFFHIVSHALMKAALFLAVGIVIYDRKIRHVRAFAGLGPILPVALGVFAVAALGMIGIPGTSGFISKLYLAIALLDGGLGLLIAVVIASAALNAMYYLPILIDSYLRENPAEPPPSGAPRVERVPAAMLAPVVALGAAILVFGFYPDLLTGWLEGAAAALQS